MNISQVLFISLILLLNFTLAFFIRTFTIYNFQPIIHQYDPWFNFRITEFLTNHNLQQFWNFFDSQTWYPLGRDIGKTIYPGIMVIIFHQLTAALIKQLLQYILIPIDIKNICIFIPAIFGGLTSITMFGLSFQISRDVASSLLSSWMIGIIPSYISRSIVGNYDNQCVSIFGLVLALYLFIRAYNSGLMLDALFSSFGYIYFVSTWGGYSFFINLIPIFCLYLVIFTKPKNNLYISYSIFYICGTLFATQIPFIHFKAFHSSEHFFSHLVFIVLQLQFFLNYLQIHLPERFIQFAKKVFILIALLIGLLMILAMLLNLSEMSVRTLSLLNPSYSRKYIPILASVSQHKPTMWTSYFFNFHFVLFFIPTGVYVIYKRKKDSLLFLGIYLILSLYFSGLMIRLLLLYAPAACIVSSIGVSYLLKKQISKLSNSSLLSYVYLILLTSLIITILTTFLFHCSIVSAERYISPTFITKQKLKGKQKLVDEFREAYYWLRVNTNPDSIIMSWWDYGYQITGLSNRTTIIDNNTWNNTHIAIVGRAFSSNQFKAYQICEMLEADYVLVVFGGGNNKNDDIGKFSWMVKISGKIFSQIKEQDFSGGKYRIDQQISQSMKNSLMYRLSYYRFWEEIFENGKKEGYDKRRKAYIGFTGYQLKKFEEAYTTQNWRLRIYRVKHNADRRIQFMKKFKQNQCWQIPHSKQYKYRKTTISQQNECI